MINKFLLQNLNIGLNAHVFLKLIGLSCLTFIFSWLNVGCRNSAQLPKTPPAKVENAVKETDLATVTLTPEAEERLKISTEPIVSQATRQTRTFTGEVVLPPDSSYSVTSPITGTIISETGLPGSGAAVGKNQTVFKILPIVTPAEREQRALLERDTGIASVNAGNDIETAKTRMEAARLRLTRASQLVRDGGGSVKAEEMAQEELRVAEIAVKAAQQRLAETKKVPQPEIIPVEIKAPRDGIVQRLHIVAGQTVASGTVLFEASAFQTVLIRVPVYVGEIKNIAARAPARIHGLNDVSGKGGRFAQPTNAPPSADPNAATADLYYLLANGDNTLRPGQRVGVTLAVNTDSVDSLVVPWASVLHDVDGGTWIYEVTAPHKYVRRRISISRVVDDIAILESGPPAGTKIVTVGASELFGTEFGTGK